MSYHSPSPPSGRRMPFSVNFTSRAKSLGSTLCARIASRYWFTQFSRQARWHTGSGAFWAETPLVAAGTPQQSDAVRPKRTKAFMAVPLS